VVDPSEVANDLVRREPEPLTRRCARRSGRRAATRRAARGGGSWWPPGRTH